MPKKSLNAGMPVKPPKAVYNSLKEAFEDWKNGLVDHQCPTGTDLHHYYCRARSILRDYRRGGDVVYPEEAHGLLADHDPNDRWAHLAGIFVSACYNACGKNDITFDGDAPEAGYIGYKLSLEKRLLISGHVGNFSCERLFGTAIIADGAMTYNAGTRSTGVIIVHGEVRGIGIGWDSSAAIILGQKGKAERIYNEGPGVIVSAGNGECCPGRDGMVVHTKRGDYSWAGERYVLVPEIIGPETLIKNATLADYVRRLCSIRTFRDIDEYEKKFGKLDTQSIRENMKRIRRLEL